MNYTENYHLPQWKKEDRIMMEDFNRMCADIEAGLGRSEKAAADAHKAANAAAGTAGAAVTPAMMQNALFRLAYNHYHLLDRQETLPPQSGVLRQLLSEAGLVTVSGLQREKDFLWAANGAEALTIGHLRSSFTCTQGLKPTQKTMIATFTVPHPGLMTQIATYGRTTNNVAGDPGDCTVRLINVTVKNAPVLEHEERSSFSFEKGNAYGGFALPVHIPLHMGQKYQLEVELDNLSSQPDMIMERAGEFCKVTGYQDASASVSCAFQAEEAGKGGLALVRYRCWGKAPTLKLEWGGGRLSPYKTRTVTDEQGQPVQETEFRQTGPIGASSTLKLICTCPAGGDTAFYQVGAVLL